MTYLQNDNKNIHVLGSYRGVLYMRACMLSHFNHVQLFVTHVLSQLSHKVISQSRFYNPWPGILKDQYKVTQLCRAL